MPTVDNENCEVNLEKIGGKYAHAVRTVVLWKVNVTIRIGKTGQGLSAELIEGFEREKYEDEETNPAAFVEEYNTALDALESLILTHACEGIDVASKAYQNGVQTALDALANNL